MDKIFEELFQDCTRFGTKILKEQYLAFGKYPIVDQGQSYIAGYTNTNDGLYNDVPAIVFGDHTRIVKYVDVPFFLGADGVKLLKVRYPRANVKYFYYALSAAHIPDTGYNRHFKWLKDLVFNYPSSEEQSKVVAVLDKTRILIFLHERQLEQLDLMVKSRFVEMFGDSTVNDKGWKIKRLDEIATTRLGKMLDAKKKTGENTYPYLANFNVQWFRFGLEKLNTMDFDEADRAAFALRYGDLLVCEGGEVGRTAIWKNELENCFFQKALHRVRCNPDICIPEYLAGVMYHKATETNFDGLVTSATIAHLTGVKLRSMKIPLPPLSLQNRFAAFAEAADKSKFEVQKGLDKTRLLYDSLISEYFAY
ncbi:MAG: restriction endonuclease subunit S [Synergistaceae bacterium]|jgi:type I restriction enzyme S subunit|nr:restriction endonuclease subunit S [Synergistaceae bacterium]